MASIVPYRGKYRALVWKDGIRKSKVFPAKGRAMAWAVDVEREIDARASGEIPDKTFGDLLIRYRDEVSIHKRGERWETLRLDAIIQRAQIAQVRLRALDTPHVAQWRDERLQTVSAASVRREWVLLSHACNLAVREWRWLKENPFSTVTRPKPSKARDRLATPDEIERLLFALGYDAATPPATQTARVGAAMLFAIETAMRCGEIVNLEWAQVDTGRRVARVLQAKNGHPRDVALSAEAIRLLEQLRPVTAAGPVFGISSTATTVTSEETRRAHLIAAAPQLLAALELLIPLHDATGNTGPADTARAARRKNIFKNPLTSHGFRV